MSGKEFNSKWVPKQPAFYVWLNPKSHQTSWKKRSSQRAQLPARSTPNFSIDKRTKKKIFIVLLCNIKEVKKIWIKPFIQLSTKVNGLFFFRFPIYCFCVMPLTDKQKVKAAENTTFLVVEETSASDYSSGRCSCLISKSTNVSYINVFLTVNYQFPLKCLWGCLVLSCIA